jgi:hypothetical protein
MGKGILRISKELILEWLMLEGFDIVNAQFKFDDQLEFLVESDCIKNDTLPRPDIKPVYHRNKLGIVRLEDILVDGKSLEVQE